MKPEIKHVWFDFSDTIARVDHELHNRIKFDTFAELSGVPQSTEREQEYKRLFEKHGRSNANIFAEEFGKHGSFWSDTVVRKAGDQLYSLSDPDIPEVLKKLSKLVPVSIFSNIETKLILESLGIDTKSLTHILSSAQLAHPKPHLEGYLKMAALSQLPPENILYIGDIEEKDIIPAKSVGLKTGIIWNKSDKADYNFNNFQEILELIGSFHSSKKS